MSFPTSETLNSSELDAYYAARAREKVEDGAEEAFESDDDDEEDSMEERAHSTMARAMPSQTSDLKRPSLHHDVDTYQQQQDSLFLNRSPHKKTRPTMERGASPHVFPPSAGGLLDVTSANALSFNQHGLTSSCAQNGQSALLRAFTSSSAATDGVGTGNSLLGLAGLGGSANRQPGYNPSLGYSNNNIESALATMRDRLQQQEWQQNARSILLGSGGGESMPNTLSSLLGGGTSHATAASNPWMMEQQQMNRNQQAALLLAQMEQTGGGAMSLGASAGSLNGLSGQGNLQTSSSSQQQQHLAYLLMAQQEQQQQQQQQQRMELMRQQQANNAVVQQLMLNQQQHTCLSAAGNRSNFGDAGTSAGDGRLDLASLLRQRTLGMNDVGQQQHLGASSLEALSRATDETFSGTTNPRNSTKHQMNQEKEEEESSYGSQKVLAQQQNNLTIAPCFVGPLPHWTSRPFFPLACDEDPNWLSEFHCFVRSELVELFRAAEPNVKERNYAIVIDQVGLRCRFCAHLCSSNRGGRSSAYPSSMRQIYQSFTMMLRDHFGGCESIPGPLLKRFLALKDKPAQGATDSKRYWIYSAMKIGIVDSDGKGMRITKDSRATGNASAPFGTNPNKRWDDDNYSKIPLVLPSDRDLVSDFLYLLISQVQPIRLQESECIGNRRSLRVGLPGFGCRSCCEHRRLGMCRVFPARRRTLPGKVADMYDHLRRCLMCPTNVKEQLEQLSYQFDDQGQNEQEKDSDFYDRMWSRLGHDSQSA